MRGHGVGAFEAEMVGNLLKGRAGAHVPLPALDEVEHLPLAFGQNEHTVWIYTIPHSPPVNVRIFTASVASGFAPQQIVFYILDSVARVSTAHKHNLEYRQRLITSWSRKHASESTPALLVIAKSQS